MLTKFILLILRIVNDLQNLSLLGKLSLDLSEVSQKS